MTTGEPRALAAALQGPAFTTRGGAAALHAANRHVERWAPEQGAARVRSLRSLGFVDRLVTPWIESAQRSASMRVFTQYVSAGAPERTPNAVSWVMPRPWFQDELDWMAAARQVGAQSAMAQTAPSMLTTRGTFVAPAQAMPAALHEYVAPSLSLARPELPMLGAGAYSPLVPFAAAQAAHVMARAVAPITRSAAMSPNLRAVLSTMLERTAASHEAMPTRASQYAPELVTPPAPRPPEGTGDVTFAEQLGAQHDRLAELQRMARAAAERELAARQAAAAPSAAELSELRAAEARAIEQRQAELQRRLGDTARRTADTSSEAAAAERKRIEERIAHRLAAMRQHEPTRLHDQSREAAARDARTAIVDQAASTAPAQSAAEPRVAEEIAAAVAALPAELAAMVGGSLGAQPERAVQAIAELGEALRTVELIARTNATGGSFESTRGPRIVMPAGLGGLVSALERTTQERAPIATGSTARVPALSFLSAPAAPAGALAATAAQRPAALGHVAWSDRWLARFAGARPQSLEVLALSASAETHLQMLAANAPHAVFVAPTVEDRDGGTGVGFTGRRVQAELARDVLPTLRPAVPEQPVLRFDDNAETPDDMLAAIAMAATRSRAAWGAPTAPASTAPAPVLPAIDPDRYRPRDTLADLVARAAPGAPDAGLSATLASSPFASALRHVISLGAAPSFDVRALFGAGLASTYLAGLVSASTSELGPDTTREAPGLDMPVVVPHAERERFDEPLTTLRSGLLTAAPPSVAGAPLARTMIDSMAMPMLADATVREQLGELATYAAPGMIAERAQAWSVAQERSSSDLAFDFVPPELVLAARVYGLGPAEAAQAARLAVAGPGLLGAMAGAVDRTFVQAMAIEAERRGERARMVTAFPVAVGDTSAAGADAIASSPAAVTPASSAFGVERRAPRGAFLWPAATIAALGMNASSPDGDQSLSLAALELLAAQAVAELGTYAALGSDRGPLGTDGATDGITRGAEPSGAADDGVVASASAMLPASRRDKFQALYVALGQATTGRSASPAARAARALALAGRGEDSVSARERATIAWDVLPVVYGMADAAADEPLSTGDAAARELRRRDGLHGFVDARAGLGALSARAGEALGSYVAPASAPAPAASAALSPREVGAVLRAPTAAPELVRTGGRHGGGEVEIPAWFEAAAKKMFEERSGASSIADGISIAELTLIAAAPSPQIAASSREPAPSPAPVAPSAAAGAGAEQAGAADIEKLANDVYREVMVLMDLARSRNGEPYL
jgi:trimeric autotransporter adhesin